MSNFPGSLHGHTHYSNFRLRDAINRVPDLIDRAIELGHECIAFTEHETVANAIEIEDYYEKIKEDNPNFKVIRGNEIYLVRDGLNAENFDKLKDKYFHFILLAKDAEGHRQIRELSTRAWMRSYTAGRMVRVPTYYQDLIDIIGANPGHVVGSTACIGGCLPTQLLRFRTLGDQRLYEACLQWCKRMEGIFGKGNFFLEMQPSFNKDQIYVNKELIKISEKLDIPYIITCDEHYLKKEDAPIHAAFLRAQEGEREVEEFYATTYLMSDEDIRKYMAESLGEEVIEKAYENIRLIKDMCVDYSLKKPLTIPRLSWKQPKEKVTAVEKAFWSEKIPYIETFLKSEYKEDNLLAENIIDRIKNDDELKNEETCNEINACLKDTWISSEKNNARWSAYFLNLQKIVDTCWEAGSLVGCGRGSGVGFILLYILGITQINPLREKTATYRWRFLNPDRVSVLDVDVDIESTKRAEVLGKLREVYGEDRVANVLTLGTEQSKSAIQTAARGLGIDVDIARYLSSMIEADRGKTRTLAQTFYGDPENGIKPNKQFVFEMTENYPELWEVAQKIEGLICRTGIHAGGVIFVDEPFTNSTALMRAPSGEIITQFDLHRAEDVSLIKYDLLSVEALDKIHICLDLLKEHGLIEKRNSLKEEYEDTIGIYNLEREAPEMWKMCWDHKVISLFQMEQQSGIKGIALLKPNSVDELAILNSTIRLMATEKGGEMPTEKLTRFKNDPLLWDYELRGHGLGPKEKAIIEPVVGISYGLCIAQEQFMQLVQLPELGGFDLTFADRLRKSIAKKNPADYEKITKEFFEETEKKGCNMKLCHYVWDVLIAMSRGYGFNQSHTLAYSLIGLQELNLAYKYPTIFWDTACLISNSGGDGAGTDYTKLAQAIGSVRKEGIKIGLPNVNTSQLGFEPDTENDEILFGLKAIMGIGDEIVEKIIANRPYTSIKDFVNKVNPTRSVMISLIKGGAFDKMMDRKAAMVWYLWETCDKKKRITLQNINGLKNYGLLPMEGEEYEAAGRAYEFNRYLKAVCKVDASTYKLDERAINYLLSIGKEDLVTDGNILSASAWDKQVYQKMMDIYRKWIRENQEEILHELNMKIFKADWDNYAKGNLSSWEMDVLCFYYHDHELKNVDKEKYSVEEFNNLPRIPVIEKSINWKGGSTNIYELYKIIGTVIARDKNKAIVYLLTPESGVVPVKFRKEYFALFDKQISVKNPDGTKSVKEKSWFTRGNKIMVLGTRIEEEFITKKYSSSAGHQLYKISGYTDDGELILATERYQGGIEEEDI